MGWLVSQTPFCQRPEAESGLACEPDPILPKARGREWAGLSARPHSAKGPRQRVGWLVSQTPFCQRPEAESGLACQPDPILPKARGREWAGLSARPHSAKGPRQRVGWLVSQTPFCQRPEAESGLACQPDPILPKARGREWAGLSARPHSAKGPRQRVGWLVSQTPFCQRPEAESGLACEPNPILPKARGREWAGLSARPHSAKGPRQRVGWLVSQTPLCHSLYLDP